METVATTDIDSAAARRPSTVAAKRTAIDWGAVATWLLAALLLIYLGLENGGYDPIPRDQVGVLVWWVILLGVAVGALPVPGRTRASLIVLGLLFAFAVWTGFAFLWTESAERTATELARVVTYLGILALGICLVTRRRAGARHVVHAVTFGLALVAAIGVLSRLHMAWFPANELGKYLPGIEIERRLSYPLNYSSAMGALAGMTLPLLLGATASARKVAMQALAAAAFPIAGLALFLSTSGTGAAVAVVAMVVLLLLIPDRLPKILSLAAGCGGAAGLILATHSRGALSRGLPTPTAEQQGTEVIWIAVAVCVAVALVQVGISLVVRHIERPPWLRPSRKSALIASLIAILIAIPIAIGAGALHTASERWEIFKSRGGSSAKTSSAESIFDFRGSGRYQFWESAVEAEESAPWTGIGPGTFEFWWSRNGSYAGFVRDAHSLYLENLAELGIIGFLLITGFVFAVLGIGAVRSLRAPPDQRLVLAIATAGAAGFAMAAALDWVWELAALPVAFMLLGAVAVSGYSTRELRERRRRKKRRRKNRQQRVAVAMTAICALLAIGIPLRATGALWKSNNDAASGHFRDALSEAQVAANLQPYAASPHVQEALLLEDKGRLAAAANAALKAVSAETTNWRLWLTLARIEAERGRLREATRALHTARSLNPKLGL